MVDLAALVAADRDRKYKRVIVRADDGRRAEFELPAPYRRVTSRRRPGCSPP
jgi:hypothetical protein